MSHVKTFAVFDSFDQRACVLKRALRKLFCVPVVFKIFDTVFYSRENFVEVESIKFVTIDIVTRFVKYVFDDLRRLKQHTFGVIGNVEFFRFREANKLFDKLILGKGNCSTGHINTVLQMPRYTPGGVTHKNSGTGPTRGVNGVRLVLQSVDKLLFGFRFVESINGVAYCPSFGRAGMTVAVEMFFENTPQICDNGFLIGRGLLHAQMVTSTLGNVNV